MINSSVLTNLGSYLPQSRRGRLLAAVTFAVVLLAALILVLRGASNRAHAPVAAAAAPAVTTRTLETMQIARGVTANGTVYAWQEIVVGPEVGGYRVAAVNVEVGDRVRKGQELVQLAEDLLAADVASKRANLEQAQASLENAESAYRRATSLSGSGALSQSDVDKLRAEELAARARVEVSKAELQAADLRLRHTHVTAPDDGVISARSVNVGQVAQVGTEMLRLLRKGRVEWRAEIPESRIREIRVGQNVKLTTADGAQLDGKVRAIAPTVESNTRAGLVYVDIPSTGAARPGMFARGEILLGQASASMAPLSSVVTQDGYTYVFVVNEQQLVVRRRVSTGGVHDTQIEIVAGVEPGERIVDKGAGFLKDGDHVRVVVGVPEAGAGS
ncbi:MAG TPA: efflux RND transporter periplasmic adaptor subunit [Steroidobacteraceae bacterium]|nr:efflux RND transporter periplasmic adaptor subunit [Steroidobacteraceae bacterium]